MCNGSDCARFGEGDEDEVGESSKPKSSGSSWVEKRLEKRFRRLSRRGTLAGKRSGSAFRMTRYNATKVPVEVVRAYRSEKCGAYLAWQPRGKNLIRRVHAV
jgi:hypothetical protein